MKSIKRTGIVLLLLFINYKCICQDTSKVEFKTFLAPSIQGNKGDEDPNRRLTIYLPPGYEKSKTRYPVIYFLHGFAIDDKDMFEWIGFKNLIDSAIKAGQLRPLILVMPNSMTKYYGSFYTNSSVAGNWADFIGKDAVEYMDKNYRTIPHRNSRGLAGHSMGGNGALKIAMLFADKFSAVYAMSPGALHLSEEFRLAHPSFKKVTEQKNMDSLRTAVPYFDFDKFPFFEMIYASLCRMYSPNINDPLLQADQPIKYIKDKMIVNTTVLKKWEANFPINMIDDHVEELKSLTALKIDWGRNEEFKHIPRTNMEFSKKLEALGIKHFAEEYIGDHGNMLDGFEGRIFTELLPFFEKYLSK
ncbi:esterase family protein [Lacibacter luteus]|uniref:Esterase family protein n=1 Tax=Lacibacter luteus TaxID=2508719 RepID=A0A4Q1CP02_9BACT|nr:alpha/beta hydrolase-fold protein [Lacibacter luteus]RXK62836.1 esterase family protein [Lacibacter luteus]